MELREFFDLFRFFLLGVSPTEKFDKNEKVFYSYSAEKRGDEWALS